MTISSSCVAVFSPDLRDRDSIFDVLESLLSLNYSVKNLSVLGKGTLEDGTSNSAIGVYRSRDKICFKGDQDEFWQGVWGVLAGEAFLHIPAFGSLAVAGGLSSILMAENGAIFYPSEYTELGRALHRIGIPEISISHYELLLKQGQLMVIVNGDNSDVENACLILEKSQGNHEVSLHFVNTS